IMTYTVSPSSTRRQWLGGAAAVMGGVMGAGLAATSQAASPSSPYPTAKAEEIVRRIKQPAIPKRDFRVADYGGRGDGKTDNSQPIAKAIAVAVKAGGGRVVLPSGVCLTGPIRLRSKVELHVPKGTRLKFIPEPARYLPVVPTRWEGVELMGYHPLVYAYGEHDIAVTGGGILDGSADDKTWWPWKGPWADGKFSDTPIAERQAGDRTRLFDMAERGVPVVERVFGEGSRLRPPFFQPYLCKNVLFEGVTVVSSPFWLLHPVLCDSVTFRGVTCDSHGPNNDGCDPESCTDVLIDNCTFNTGDDCIAIKAGRNADGRRVAKPCENLVIRNCLMKDGHVGVAIGSEMTGGVRNVYVQDCTMDSPHLSQALGIKTNGYRGGVVEDIHMTRIKVGRVDKTFLQIWLYYEEGEGGAFVPSVRRITLSESRVVSTRRVLVIRGRPDSPVTGLTLSHLVVGEEQQPSVVIDARDVALDHVTIAGKAWTAADVARLPGLDSVTCDKWAMCR
ncbi:glycoside hydrolase family 28 protein, partial [Asticcacaulis sp. BYS171W]